MKTFSHGPFLGLNTLLSDSKLAVKDQGQYLRQAVNIDLDNSGWARRRDGYALLATLSGAHSLWSNGTRTLYVQGTTLWEVTDFSSYAASARATLAATDAMSYCSVNGDVYYTNGTDSGRLAASSSSAGPWALATPADPVLSVTTGSLPAGWYQVALTYSTALLEEGGSTPAESIELTSIGGITVALPGVSAGAAYVNVYVSAANGEVPTWHSRVTAATTSATVTTPPTKHKVPNAFLQPQAAGQIVAAHNGRLLVATDSMLSYSQPWNFGLMLPTAGYIPFPETITNVVPCTGGVFITTTKQTSWLAGADIATADVVPVFPYGAVPGTAFDIPNTVQVGWFGNRGVVIGDSTGQAKAIQEATVSVDTAPQGAVLVREFDKVRSVLTTLIGTKTTPLLTSSTLAGEDADRLHDFLGTSNLTTYNVNLMTNATTQYEHFDFNSMCLASNGAYYGMSSDGLYQLTGDTDADAKIEAMLSLGKQDFGTQALKHLAGAYLGVMSDTPMRVRVMANGAQYDYLARDYDSGLMQQRVDTGRGLRANYFTLDVYNTDGGQFELATLDACINLISQRRI